MNIPIELLIVLALFVICGLLGVFLFISKYFKIWRYKPQNDKGRLAEESRRGSGLQRNVLPTSSKRFNLLPTAPIDSVGTIKSAIGKTSDSPRKLGFFKRR